MNARPATDSDTPTYFIDEGSHAQRTEVPNLIDDLGLSIYAHRLYAHVKRRAGEGEKGSCTAGLRGMAKFCGMSLGMAAKARQELLDLGLIRCHEEIVRHKDGGGRYEVLTVADIWPANFTFYARRKQLVPLDQFEVRSAAARAHLICFLVERGHEVVRHRPKGQGAGPELWSLGEAREHLATFLSGGGVSPREHPSGGVSPHERGCSPHDTPGVSPRERKKEPIGRRTSEEHTHTPRARATAPSAAAGVSVEKTSRHSLKVRKEHAERNGLGGGWLTNSRDGRYDEAIDAELERLSPEAIEAKRSAPPDNQMTRSGAVQYVRSVCSGFPNSDPGAVAGELFRTGQIDDGLFKDILRLHREGKLVPGHSASPRAAVEPPPSVARPAGLYAVAPPRSVRS